MKRIHEIDLREIAQMNENDLEKLVEIEMMVAKVSWHKIEPYPEMPKFAGVPMASMTVYDRTSVGFDENGSAVALEYSYVDGHSLYYFSPQRNVNQIEVRVYSEREVKEYAKKASENKKSVKKIEENNRQNRKSNKTVESIRQQVRAICYHAVDMSNEMQNILDTEDKYVKLCDGDHSVAERFLVEKFGQYKVNKCRDWFSEDEKISFLPDKKVSIEVEGDE